MPALPTQPDHPWPGALEFAQLWATSIADTSVVPLDVQENTRLFSLLTARLIDALRSESFAPEWMQTIGTHLVSAGFSSPEALGRTVSIISSQLISTLGPCLASHPGRLQQVVECLATGYARAIRDRTLHEQETLRRAALNVHTEVQAAQRLGEDQQRHAALHDPLTGLPNRTMFIDWLSSRFMPRTRGGRLAVCALNLDRFDIVNDCLGQEAGDEILATVARRLSVLAQQHGFLLARLGGDEFGLLMEPTSGADDVPPVAEEFLNAVAQPIHIDGHQVAITASMGIVEQHLARTNTTELTRAARMSLRWAKTDGRARWVLFDPIRGAHQVERSSLSAQMPAALQRGEFELVYQPLVDLIDGDTCGVEALARWKHPVHGLIGPDRFIDLAEDTGLIIALGEYLLEQACRQAFTWHQLTPRAPFVSVNLAVRQLRHPGIADRVHGVLQSSGLPASQLQLEITESAVLKTDDDTIETLRTLANLGVRLAIDDFGTGYANFAYLRTLPVHALKLDGFFIRSLETGDDPDGEAIVETMVSLGHRLGLTVTSEGVETASQAKCLAALGCDAAQGWHFGRPSTPDQITRLITP